MNAIDKMAEQLKEARQAMWQARSEVETLRQQNVTLMADAVRTREELRHLVARCERLESQNVSDEDLLAEVRRLRAELAMVKTTEEVAVRAWHSFRSGGLTHGNGCDFGLRDRDIEVLVKLAGAK